MDNLKSMYLSDQGRIARLPYFLYALGLTVVMVVLLFILVPIIGLIGGLVAYVIFIYPFYCLMAKRLQDFDKPGKWAWIVIAVGLLGSLLSLSEATMAIGSLVSLLQLILALIILFMPGTKGSNQYGAEPA
jgi:uncharacterized membrane protein YhaH (DUF805 family)